MSINSQPWWTFLGCHFLHSWVVFAEDLCHNVNKVKMSITLFLSTESWSLCTWMTFTSTRRCICPPPSHSYNSLSCYFLSILMFQLRALVLQTSSSVRPPCIASQSCGCATRTRTVLTALTRPIVVSGHSYYSQIRALVSHTRRPIWKSDWG